VKIAKPSLANDITGIFSSSRKELNRAPDTFPAQFSNKLKILTQSTVRITTASRDSLKRDKDGVNDSSRCNQLTVYLVRTNGGSNDLRPTWPPTSNAAATPASSLGQCNRYACINDPCGCQMQRLFLVHVERVS
jgi:hypothetical protein